MGISQVGRPSFRWSTLKPLHPSSIKIKNAKYKNLLTLLDFIPPVNHAFYKNLKHDGKTAKATNQRAKRVPTSENGSQPERADEDDVDQIEDTADPDNDPDSDEDNVLDSDYE